MVVSFAATRSVFREQLAERIREAREQLVARQRVADGKPLTLLAAPSRR
jgi:hypothetical protein